VIPESGRRFCQSQRTGWDEAWARLSGERGEGAVKRSAEVLCSGKEARGGRLFGDGEGDLGYTLTCEAVCSGNPARDSLLVGDGCDGLGYMLACEAVCLCDPARVSRFFGDGSDGLGHTLCLVGTDSGV
jgi:hypothetical protein